MVTFTCFIADMEYIPHQKDGKPEKPEPQNLSNSNKDEAVAGYFSLTGGLGCSVIYTGTLVILL